ncbi:hypothetical protein GCM10023184_45160 [Flaviaesturariibacter amylovorans]|uniref:Lipocalin-like domain-containing protein n=1 Tax=Flaviaesturariibacter amylovorans TaxID=1084520 RepID=A0ABP8HTG3_9BACT
MLLSILLALPLLLGSCKKEEEERPVYEMSQFVGRWRMHSHTSTEAYHWYGSSSPGTSLFAGSNACAANNSFDLKADGSAVIGICSTSWATAQWKLDWDILYYRLNGSDPWISLGRVFERTDFAFTTTISQQAPTGNMTTVNARFFPH